VDRALDDVEVRVEEEVVEGHQDVELAGDLQIRGRDIGQRGGSPHLAAHPIP
jgi:hypothetical protein